MHLLSKLLRSFIREGTLRIRDADGEVHGGRSVRHLLTISRLIVVQDDVRRGATTSRTLSIAAGNGARSTVTGTYCAENQAALVHNCFEARRAPSVND